MISSSTYERQKAEAPPSPCSNNENCKPNNDDGMHLCSSENVVHTLAQPLPTQLIDDNVKSTKNGRFRFSGRNKNNKSRTPQDLKKARKDCLSTTRHVPASPKHHSIDISNTTIEVNGAESVIPPARSTSGNKKRHFGLRLRRSFDRFNSLHMSHKAKQFHDSRSVDGIDLNISREKSDAVPDDKERWKYDPNLKHKKSVSFTSLSIREFDLCLGDNPSCSDGLPLSLSWNCLRSETIDLESYERCRGPRRSMAELKMEPEFRRELVCACLPPESSMRKTEREQYRSRNRDSTATMRRKQSDKLKAGFFCPLPTKTDQTSLSVPI